MDKGIERKQVPEELLTTERRARIRAKMKPVEVDAKKRPNLSLKAKSRIAYINMKQRLKRRIMAIMTSKTEKAIRKQVGDATWYGKLLFAILDVLPLPNLHEIWKAVQLAWEHAPDVMRSSQAVVQIFEALQLTPEQGDDIFKRAKALEI